MLTILRFGPTGRATVGTLFAAPATPAELVLPVLEWLDALAIISYMVLSVTLKGSLAHSTGVALQKVDSDAAKLQLDATLLPVA